MKLTDEAVAKALGWKRESPKSKWWLNPAMEDKGFYTHSDHLPKWTTSMDAITIEIKAQGLRWAATYDGWGKVWKDGKTPNGLSTATEDTTPKALCAALLAYLKVKR